MTDSASIMDYFAHITTASGAHRRYRMLAMKWHPDRCTDEHADNVMADINRDYKECLKRIDVARDHDSMPTSSDVVSVPVPTKGRQRKPKSPKRKVDPDVDRILGRGGELLTDICGAAIRRGIEWVKERLADSKD